MTRLLAITLLGLMACTATPAPGSSGRVYLDGRLERSCEGSYSFESRNCSGSDGNAYPTLEALRFRGGDTVILRPGRYVGSLRITAAGTEDRPTVVETSPGEERQAVICAPVRQGEPCRLPEVGGSPDFYTDAAIVIPTDHVRVRNLRTFGSLVPGDRGRTNHDVVVEGCDLGGGGPGKGPGWAVASSQGMVVAPHSVYDLVLRNNKIHHSVKGDAPHNGACLLGYDFHAVIENNEFRDCTDAAIFIKDTDGQEGRTIEIRRNFLDMRTGRGDGIRGHNQSAVVDQVVVEYNVIHTAGYGFRTLISPPRGYVVRHNTFVSGEYALGETASSDRTKVTATNNLFHGGGVSFRGGDLMFDRNCYHRATGPRDEEERFRGDPMLVDPSGTSPAAFKRGGYGEEFRDGSRCGAYVTGDEAIGVDWVE